MRIKSHKNAGFQRANTQFGGNRNYQPTNFWEQIRPATNENTQEKKTTAKTNKRTSNVLPMKKKQAPKSTAKRGRKG